MNGSMSPPADRNRIFSATTPGRVGSDEQDAFGPCDRAAEAEAQVHYGAELSAVVPSVVKGVSRQVLIENFF